MPLNVPAGEKCLLDANILTYYLIASPPFTAPVDQFIRSVASGHVQAFTSNILVSEALHRVMLAEVLQRFPHCGRPLPFVQRRPHIIHQLIVYRAAAQRLSQIGLQLIEINFATWNLAAQIAASFSLLTNDACILATLQQNSIKHLVTNDDDFNGMPGITVHQPR